MFSKMIVTTYLCSDFFRLKDIYENDYKSEVR